MINDKYLSSDSFEIWNNAKIYCCNHFRCHIYKYLLNIRTMIEGWERFWWCVMWLKYSFLIGQLSLFTVNKSTWSCFYGVLLSLSCLFVWSLSIFHFMLIWWHKYGFHISLTVFILYWRNYMQCLVT